jgi:UDP-glucose 4-epimerase
MNILVLGGNGFIGSHFVKSIDPEHNVSLFKGHTDHADFTGQFTDIDIVYDFMWSFTPASSWENPVGQIEDIMNTCYVAQYAIKNKVKKFVFISSGTVYGKECVGAHEGWECYPYTPYAISKFAAENYLNFYKDKYDIDVDIYRIANVYGKWDKEKKNGIIPIWMKAIKNNEPIKVIGNSIIDYIYVEDVAKLLQHSIDSVGSEIFNIGNSNPVSTNELLIMFKNLIDMPFKIDTLPARKSDSEFITLDARKLMAHFPGFKFATLEEKIPELWEYYK